jgi:hypothetical protein
MKKMLLLLLLLTAAASYSHAGYSDSRRRRAELREQYGTDSPTWEMLSNGDKAGTLVVGAIVLAVIFVKVKE